MIKYRPRKTKMDPIDVAIVGRPVEWYLCCDLCGQEAKQGTHIVTFSKDGNNKVEIRCKVKCDTDHSCSWNDISNVTIRVPKASKAEVDKHFKEADNV